MNEKFVKGIAKEEAQIQFEKEKELEKMRMFQSGNLLSSATVSIPLRDFQRLEHMAKFSINDEMFSSLIENLMQFVPEEDKYKFDECSKHIIQKLRTEIEDNF